MGAPEKMSVRTLLMYTGKNPADRDSKNRLVKNLIKAGIPPVEIPAYITSAFSRLTEGKRGRERFSPGDTRTLGSGMSLAT